MADNFPPSQRLDPYAHGIASGFSDLFTPFLGPPPRPERNMPFAKKSIATWNMPESYLTENLVLRDTVEDWMLTANQTWYTERIMPWYQTDDIHVQWEQWEHNAHYMGITPHQAPSNVVTQKRTIRRASMVRRGIAAEFEHDFVATARGRTSFIASLAQIGRSVQETANVEVLRALLGCHAYQQIYLRKSNILKHDDLDGWLNHKAERFMIAQKTEFGLEILNTQIEREQEQYRAQANVWILGREIMDYCALVPEGKIFYYLGGQEAVDRVNGRGQNGSAAAGTMGNVRSLQPPRMISDTPVYLAKSYFVEGIGALDLLSRTVEVGVFNTMIDNTRNYDDYRSGHRNIRVYDNDRDDWAEIKLEDAIEACVIWDEKVGDVSDPFNGRHERARTESAQDLAEDFLRFGTGFDDLNRNDKSRGAYGTFAKQDVAIIGDLDAKWLTRAQCENAGRTIRATLGRSGFATVLNGLQDGGTVDATKIKAGVFGTESWQIPLADAPIMSAIAAVLGTDNLFFRDAEGVAGLDGKVASSRNVARGGLSKTWQTFKYANVYGVRKSGTGPGELAPIQTEAAGAPSAAKQEEWHASYLKSRLGVVVPATHKAELEKIASDSSQPWQQRAAAIENLCVQLKRSDPTSIPGMSDEERIRSWMLKANKEYEQGLAAKLQASVRSSASSASSSGGGGEDIDADITYIPIGTPLPAGFKYASANDARKAQGPSKSCPSSLRDFPHLAHIWAENVGADAQAMGGGARRRGGFDPIGVTADRGEAAAGQPDANRDARLARRFQNLDDRIAEIAAGGAPLVVKWLAILWCGSMFTKETFKRFAVHDIMVPNFLLMRPHATYRTRYGIKCAANGQSGYTFFGHSNMQLEHEAARKVGMMHYTAYLTAVVTQPKNVYVVEDIFCERYLGGMGVKFWKHATEYKNANGKRTRASIICTMLPFNMAQHQIDQKLDVRGRWHTAHEIELISAETFAKVCYPGGARTALIMGWWDSARRGKGPGSQVVSRGVDVNYVCWQGVQWHVNPITGEWGNVIIEQGNFGPNVGPGSGLVRNGRMKLNPVPSYLGGTAQARH